MSMITMKETTTHRPVLIVAALLAALLAALGMRLYFAGIWPDADVQIVREPVSQPLGTATRAEVEIAIGVGHLRIGALEQSSELIAGEIAYPNRNRVTRNAGVQGDTATFSLREQDSQINSLVKFNRDTAIWELRLNPATPMRLTLETAVSEGTIDLAQLHVTDFTLKTGVGSIDLTLPGQGHVQAQIEGGVSETLIRVPAGVAVRVESSAGLGSISLPRDYQRQGDAHVSPGYATAANRVDLQVTSGIGDIVITQISE